MRICIILFSIKYKDKIKKFFNKTFKDIPVEIIYKYWYEKNLIKFIKKSKIDGIILSGSEHRIIKKNNITISKKILDLNIPILGVCYGYQLLIKMLVKKGIKSFNSKRKYYKKLIIKEPFKIKALKYKFNHNDYIIKIPNNWHILIEKEGKILMAYDKERKIMGIQFHPESSLKTKIFYKKWLNYIKH
jgi:GMP synthase (glutamine-hydrolysing)